MNYDNVTINSFWKGRPFSNVEKLCVRSFLAHGHRFKLYAFDDVEGCPPGCDLADANEIVPVERFFVNRNPGFGYGSPSPFSDLFRMALLERKGGWWTDMDVICLRPWDFTSSNVVASSDERQWGVIPNANVLKMPAGSSFAKYCLRVLGSQQPDQATHAAGPHAVQAAVRELELSSAVVPPWNFNPVQWRYVKYLLKPEEVFCHPRRVKRTLGITERLGRISSHSYAVHLWSEVWTQAGYDRNASYHPQSTFEQLKSRYGVT